MGYTDKEVGRMTLKKLLKLYKHYKNILATSEIHIYVSGNIDESDIENIIKDKFDCSPQPNLVDMILSL